MAKVLIHGLNPLGAEIAKNLVLTVGVTLNLTLSDTNLVQTWELCGTSMYSVDSLGKNKAHVCVKKLKEIGSSVEISSLTTDLTADCLEILSQYQVVVLANAPQELAIKVDSYCHNHEIAFIYVDCIGLFGRIFCDFGDEYVCLDNKVLKFRELKECLKDFGDNVLMKVDETKHSQMPLLHLAFQALHTFKELYSSYPAESKEDVERFIDLVALMNKVEKIDDKLLTKFALGAGLMLTPMSLLFSGVVGQQVAKVVLRKPQPIFQFLYFDAAECLPSNKDLGTHAIRYEAQVAIFGSTLQTKFEDANVLFVGSGAVAYEFIKAMAIMGIGCGRGKIFVLDDATTWDIGMAASIVSAKLINHAIDIQVLENNVSPHVGDDSFWKNLSVVINCLTMNVHQRPQIDWKSYNHRKPMIKLTTLLDSCSTKIIIPSVTDEASSKASNSPLFPRDIEDCLRWSLSEFKILFEKMPAEANTYLSTPEEYIKAMEKVKVVEARRILKCILEYLHTKQSMCVLHWARGRFDHYFNSKEIRTLSLNGSKVVPIKFSSGDETHQQFMMAAEELISRNVGLPDLVEDDAISGTYLNDQSRQQWATTVSQIVVPAEDETTSLDNIVINLEKFRKQIDAKFQLKPIVFHEDDIVHMEMVTCLANLRARVFKLAETDRFSAKMIVKAVTAENEIPSFAAIPAGLICLELCKVLEGNHTCSDYREADVQLARGKFKMLMPTPPPTSMHH